MALVPEENVDIKRFRQWFTENGGKIHEDATFSPDDSGYSVIALKDIPSGAVIMSCPFSLAVTVESTREPLKQYFKLDAQKQGEFSERQRICAYIALHWIIPAEDDKRQILLHRPYIDILPKPESLRTPLYFSETELNMFQGTNMFGAVKDQISSWQAEYQNLYDSLIELSPEISKSFSWEMYRAAATYLSSRAFPSTLLSATPSLIASPSSYQVLLPGVDSLNHKRGHPAIWKVSKNDKHATTTSEVDKVDDHLSIELSSEVAYQQGDELFNNYGPKPNSSLILGYGFALPNNPDDTILLKIGSSSKHQVGNSTSGSSQPSQGLEVGRNAVGANKVWDSVRRLISQNYDVDESISEDDLEVMDLQIDVETAGTLSDMVRNLRSRLPETVMSVDKPEGVRGEVYDMWVVYVRGQIEILDSFLEWVGERNSTALGRAEELGVGLLDDVEEDDEEDDV